MTRPPIAGAALLVLVGIFLVGYAEAVILNSRGRQCVTWLLVPQTTSD